MISPASIKNINTYIKEKIGFIQPETVGVILGSGLGDAVTRMDEASTVSYSDIPGFPCSTVKGHSGKIIYGKLKGKPVMVFSGRFHLYEGYSPAQACIPVRVMGDLGISRIIITNAAGALNPQFDAGDLMLVTDHINFTGQSPLTGENYEEWGLRFPDMSRVYSRRLIETAIKCSLQEGVRLERGVYIQVPGPQLETPAETRMLKNMGADAVGMSTVIEAIAATHMGIETMAVACLTNKNLPDCMEKTTHEQVIEQAQKSSDALSRLILAVISSI
ncbi:purine-nucleoside phosphorylase [Maridesulfovibrio bastinii]|uniref:purine-nucleoside phosphorylase n=1 Tax=Maridesulfovibrio bastinii TaxID=47157 RepID=UPI000418178A|nr:purine-nucleoside phosphorylase [Maridesulfovibrio bastinii]